ncbi:SIR2 family protein [Nocardioides immobilis]|uniref:SIR2 family protein n=1 Tax=Nocardioides immobilis TaxID=2049295 RepID=A0A417XYK5_9ACTN|nr:SIR2 family protein [Nocardioides immobilis]RHW25443.1 SIR2 family protein [Nocardioides immobilis]
MTNLDALVRSAAARQLVPFVGAGISESLINQNTGKPLMPSWRAFLRGCAMDLSVENRDAVLQLVREEELAQAASRVKLAVGTAHWIERLRTTFEVSRSSAQESDVDLLHKIWKVSRGLVVTTNYDETLLWGRRESEPLPTVYGLHAPADLSTLLEANRESPVLWHLHGTITHPNSIVLEQKEYARLYDGINAELSEDDPPAELRHQAAFICLQTMAACQSLLFLGFSLTDPNVNRVLRDMHALFSEARVGHYMVCLAEEVDHLERRFADERLEHINLLPVSSFGEPVRRLLDDLLAGEPSAIDLKVTEQAWIRRRCRTVVAGGDEFVARMRPLIAEHSPADAAVRLSDIIMDPAATPFQRGIASALWSEFEVQLERMRDSTASALASEGLTSVERLNLLLFQALAMEKLGPGTQVSAAKVTLESIINAPEAPDELRRCAEFNRDVCREKLNDPTLSFAPYMSDRRFRFSSREFLWTKAWNMELVRCGRRGEAFRYESMLQDVLSAEIDEASTGFAKTVANWGKFKRDPLDESLLERMLDVARRSTPTQRVPLLLYLESVTGDHTLRQAINDALERSGNSATLRRLIQTRRVKGRYTLYGEYLMHTKAWGYVAPTPMYLQGAPESVDVGLNWLGESDRTRTLVRSLGLDVLDDVSGSLPMGQGFASSTVLAVLHLGDQVSAEKRAQLLEVFDWLSHGFPPSGVDSASVLAQEPGFYFRNTWRRAPSIPINAVFVASVGEPTVALAQARSRVEELSSRLKPLAEQMTTTISSDQTLDLDAFASYCALLRTAGIYTDDQMNTLAEATSLGLHAKAIGGLANKAMLVIGDDARLDQLVERFPTDRIIGRLGSSATTA